MGGRGWRNTPVSEVYETEGFVSAARYERAVRFLARQPVTAKLKCFKHCLISTGSPFSAISSAIIKEMGIPHTILVLLVKNIL